MTHSTTNDSTIASRSAHLLWYALSLGTLVIAWQIAAIVIDSPLVLPAPLVVGKRLLVLGTTADFWRQVGATGIRVAKSFAFVLVFGTAVGLLCGMNRTAARLFSVPLSLIRSVPVVSFILLALFWLKTDNVPVFCAVLMAFPVMVTAISGGCEKGDKQLLAMATVFRFSRWQRFRFVYADELKPFFASGAIASFGMIWKVVAAGEVLSVPRRAIGTLLQTAQVHLETQDVLAVSMILVAVSFCAERLLALLLHVLFRPRRRAFAHFLEESNLTALSVQTDSPAIVPRDICLRDVRLCAGETVLAEHFALSVEKGAILALIAPSGAGKTTLLNHLAFASGELVSYLFQEPRLLSQCTALGNVVIPLLHVMDARSACARAASVLRDAGLGERLYAFPDELSGGERQRVALSRALAFPASVLLLDEPFQSQDIRTKRSLMQIIEKRLQKEPRTVVFVTHDMDEAAVLGSRIVALVPSPLRVAGDVQNDRSLPLAERFKKIYAPAHPGLAALQPLLF